MKKIALIAAVLLVTFTACKKNKFEPDGEGVYLGVIGFNDKLTSFDIRKLTSDSKGDFTDFIDDLTASDATALYYADYSALQMMQKYTQPPKLKNVVLVTFTDGLDNASLELDNPGYESRDAYSSGLHSKIMNEKIHGLNVQAYTIGLKGNDVRSTDDAMFNSNMNNLASSADNVFLVQNMTEVLSRFSEIADNLNSTSTSVNVDIQINGGRDDGQVIRFTFDGVTAAENSNLYIEATFRRSDPRTLENVTYYGFTPGASSISGTKDGVKWHFVFSNLLYANGNTISQTDINRVKLWDKTSDGSWSKDSEFDQQDKPQVTEDRNSALIMLVLDCTTSLGSDFNKMKQAGNRFVERLASSVASK